MYIIFFVVVLFINYSILPVADPVTLLLMLTPGANGESSARHRSLDAAERQRQGGTSTLQRPSGMGWWDNTGFSLWVKHAWEIRGAPLPPSTHSIHFTTLSPLPWLSLHISTPFPFPFPSQAEVQYSTDLEFVSASVPSSTLVKFLNGPSYTILTTMVPLKSC